MHFSLNTILELSKKCMCWCFIHYWVYRMLVYTDGSAYWWQILTRIKIQTYCGFIFGAKIWSLLPRSTERFTSKCTASDIFEHRHGARLESWTGYRVSWSFTQLLQAHNEIIMNWTADLGGGAVKGAGLQPLACCEWGFESRRMNECFFCILWFVR